MPSVQPARIGPAYIDKAARRGLRTGEILEPESFRNKVKGHFIQIDQQLQSLYHKEPLDVETMTGDWVASASKLAPYIQDSSTLLHDALRSSDQVLAEGAQGTLLDLDYGTYPFVTSSCTTATGVFSGLGLGIMRLTASLGSPKHFKPAWVPAHFPRNFPVIWQSVCVEQGPIRGTNLAPPQVVPAGLAGWIWFFCDMPYRSME